jgi:hypothetical protein
MYGVGKTKICTESDMHRERENERDITRENKDRDVRRGKIERWTEQYVHERERI